MASFKAKFTLSIICCYAYKLGKLFRRRLSAEGAKPESNNRWKSELGHVCGYVGGWVWNYLANQGT